MTISVTVKNEDTRPDAAIIVRLHDKDGDQVPGYPDNELIGGQSITHQLHSGMVIGVREVTKSPPAVQGGPVSSAAQPVEGGTPTEFPVA